MRRYDDPVDVRRGWVTGIEGPEQFLWHGRLWKVRAVLAHWVETAPWWQSSGARAVVGSDEGTADGRPAGRTAGGLGADLLVERELWRVEAGSGRAWSDGGPGVGPENGSEGGSGHGSGSGVFDLSFDGAEGAWLLVGCAD